MKDVPMGDILPGIIGNVERHRGEVVQMILPNTPPTVDNPPTMFQDLHVSSAASTTPLYDSRHVSR